MPIFTFSTKGSRPQDTETIERIKTKCSNRGLNFSALILRELTKWEEEDVRCRQVQSDSKTA